MVSSPQPGSFRPARPLAAVLAALLMASAAGAQEQPQQQPQEPPQPAPQTSFRASVSEVIVPVTVTDDKGRFVSNLDVNDFKVFDQGQEQRIEFFSRDRNQPVVVGFLLDLSNNSRLHWKTFQESAKELVWALLPGEPKFTGYLITYGNEAELAVNTTQDSDKITARIDKVKPGGGAALFDAIYMACTSRELVKGEPYEPRRVIIVIGDGNDNASKHSLDQVIELAQRNLVTIYGLSTQAFGFSASGDSTLQRLADETGGSVEYPLEGVYKDVAGFLSTPSDEGNYALRVGTGGYAAQIAASIVQSVGGIVGEVTTQYILRYSPDIGPGSDTRQFRNIRVSVGLENVKVRYRKGYYPYAP